MLLDSVFFSSMSCPGRKNLFPQISKCLRRFDPFTGVLLTSGVCIIPGFLKCEGLLSDKTKWQWPAILKFFVSYPKFEGFLSNKTICMAVFKFLISLSLSTIPLAIAVGMIELSMDEDRSNLAWLTSLGIFLTSFGWWQNFTTNKKYLKLLHKIKLNTAVL